jgi:hypothetical protein
LGRRVDEKRLDQEEIKDLDAVRGMNVRGYTALITHRLGMGDAGFSAASCPHSEWLKWAGFK